MELYEMLGGRVSEDCDGQTILQTEVTGCMLQQDGILSGGISAYLAETVGGLAGVGAIPDGYQPVGLSLTSTHLLSVEEGDTIKSVATPISLGHRVQNWKIEQYRMSDGGLFNVSQLTSYLRKCR